MSADWKDRIRQRAAELGFSHRQLASRAGLASESHVSTMLSDAGTSNPGLETLVKVASALDVSLDWIANGDSEEKQTPSGLGARLAWILAHRDLSQRQLARRAGLKNTHVSTIMKRLRDDPAATIEADTLTKLAHGGEVPVQWLATGEGEPSVDSVRDSRTLGLKDRLRLVVAHSGLTQRNFADKAGLASSTHVSAILSASAPNPTLDTLSKLAAAGGVSLDWLANGIGPEPEFSAEVRALASRRPVCVASSDGESAPTLASTVGQVAERIVALERQLAEAKAEMRRLLAAEETKP